MAGKKTIFTIGHSTRTAAEFLGLLRAHGVAEVVDIRTIPKSRHNPQFNKETLGPFLRRHRIGYRHLMALGGLRHSKKDSTNLGWENLSFRGFADYMATPQFANGISRLEKIATKRKTVIMCAEAVPWRCHRSLVADALAKEKWTVFHIMSKKTANKHKRTPFLRIRKGMLTYPAPRS